jgi:hypothetical protein
MIHARRDMDRMVSAATPRQRQIKKSRGRASRDFTVYRQPRELPVKGVVEAERQGILGMRHEWLSGDGRAEWRWRHGK